MSDRFADTNILVYLTSGDRSKSDTAERLLDEGLVISVQVMNELALVLRRKIKLEWQPVHHLLRNIAAVSTVVPLTLDIHRLGLVLSEKHSFPICDAMIVAAALEAGCTTLYSEDMQHGQLIAGRLRITNPFL